MDTPRSGFRRATATSWALVGLGIASVAGTSALAYADTFKPPATEAPVYPVDSAPQEPVAPPVPDVPAPAAPATTTADPEPTVEQAAPAPTVEQAPRTRTTAEYTPEYTPQQTYEPAPDPTRAPTTPPTTKRRNLTPTTVMAPNFSPHITMSHGS